MTAIVLLAVAACLVIPLTRLTWPQIGAVYGLIAVLYVAMTALLGEPKPARVELLASLDRAQIRYVEGSATEGIYIVTTGPKLYSLPWSEATARAIHEAMRAAEAQGGTVELREPHDGTPGGEWSAVHVPPPPPQPKG